MSDKFEALKEEFVKDVKNSGLKESPVNRVDAIVTAYAGSANCDPQQIPTLYANLYVLLKSGQL